MPDYSLQRNNPLPNTPQQSPLTQLSQAGQQAKLETENTLLREALATSAQNCEVLMKQLTESQKAFQMEMLQRISGLQAIEGRLEKNTRHSLDEMNVLIEVNDKNHQNQLQKLQNMNQSFIQSLNSVLATVEDKLIAQIKADTVIALQANMTAMNEAVQSHIATMNTAYASITKTAEKVTNYDTKLKTSLDKRIKSYNESIQRLFKLDDWREMLFLAGMAGAILTPLALIINWLF